MSWRILNAEPAGYSEEARRILEGVGEVVEEPVPQAALAERVRGFEVLIVRLGLEVDRGVLEGAADLQAVVTATTGLDHVDLEAAAGRGIAVLSLRGERELLRSIPATAEHTWALLLALLRRIPWAFDEVRCGGWDRDRFRGGELAGRRLGILGLGRVGRQVAGFAAAFGMEVGALDRGPGAWPEGVRRFEALETLLPWSQILSVHVPLTDETRGLLGRARLELLPPGAVLVNTSRGGLLDEAALASLLAEGRLAGAAVDVLADERSAEARAQSPLIEHAGRHSNLLITPHLAGATRESMERTEVFMAHKLHDFWNQRTRGRASGLP